MKFGCRKLEERGRGDSYEGIDPESRGRVMLKSCQQYVTRRPVSSFRCQTCLIVLAEHY